MILKHSNTTLVKVKWIASWLMWLTLNIQIQHLLKLNNDDTFSMCNGNGIQIQHLLKLNP